MKVLIADNNAASCSQLQRCVEQWGYEVEMADNGGDAWKILAQPDGPSMAILDWGLPHMTGLEVCRKLRETRREPYTYLLLIVYQSNKAATLAGVEAGADDCIVKPFEQQELSVRLRAGRRIIELQKELMRARG